MSIRDEMVRKLTRDLADLIRSDKEHQKKYGFENRHTILGYNRAILMIEEHGPELLSEALVSEASILSLVEKREETPPQVEEALKEIDDIENYLAEYIDSYNEAEIGEMLSKIKAILTGGEGE